MDHYPIQDMMIEVFANCSLINNGCLSVLLAKLTFPYRVELNLSVTFVGSSSNFRYSI